MKSRSQLKVSYVSLRVPIIWGNVKKCEEGESVRETVNSVCLCDPLSLLFMPLMPGKSILCQSNLSPSFSLSLSLSSTGDTVVVVACYFFYSSLPLFLSFSLLAIQWDRPSIHRKFIAVCVYIHLLATEWSSCEAKCGQSEDAGIKSIHHTSLVDQAGHWSQVDQASPSFSLSLSLPLHVVATVSYLWWWVAFFLSSLSPFIFWTEE